MAKKITLEELENKEFFEKLNKVYEECVGNETFGSRTEYFDEDGCLLMTTEEHGNETIFEFGIEDVYTIPTVDVIN